MKGPATRSLPRFQMTIPAAQETSPLISELSYEIGFPFKLRSKHSLMRISIVVIRAAPPGGPRSYNKGAGMVRVSIAASFIKRTMPLGQGGTLSDEEAYDVATFINSQPRPEFPGRGQDWPNGGRPDDILY
jgi:hypothetical protein